MKLMLLIIPTIQTIVNPIAIRAVEVDVAGAERVGDEVDRDPEPRPRRRRARPGRAAASGPAAGACRRARRRPWRGRRRASSADELGRADRARDRHERESVVDAIRTPSATTRNAIATAMPPPRGIGRLLTRRWSGRSMASRRIASRRTSGVSSSAISAAATNADDEERQQLAERRRSGASGDQAASRGEARHREAGHQLARPRRGSVVDGRVVAMPDRLHDPSPDLAHLVRAHAARRRRRRPDPDAGRDVGRVGCRTGSRSC